MERNKAYERIDCSSFTVVGTVSQLYNTESGLEKGNQIQVSIVKMWNVRQILEMRGKELIHLKHLDNHKSSIFPQKQDGLEKQKQPQVFAWVRHMIMKDLKIGKLEREKKRVKRKLYRLVAKTC